MARTGGAVITVNISIAYITFMVAEEGLFIYNKNRKSCESHVFMALICPSNLPSLLLGCFFSGVRKMTPTDLLLSWVRRC